MSSWWVLSVSATVAGVVALVVARTTVISGREAWVRDQRYAAYREVVQRAVDLSPRRVRVLVGLHGVRLSAGRR